MVRAAIRRAGGNVAGAARLLGIQRTHVYRYTRAAGLDPLALAAEFRP